MEETASLELGKEHALVDGHDGSRTPFGKLATIQPTFGLETINLEAGSRRIAIEASVIGRDLGSAARQAHSELTEKLKLPAGYSWDLGGKVESQARAQQALHLAVGLLPLCVFCSSMSHSARWRRPP